MKREIDGLLSKDQDLQRFLGWVEKKSCSTKNHYKPAAVRAYYLGRTLDRAHAHARELARVLDRALDLDRVLAHALTFAQVLALDLAFDFDPSLDLAFDLAFDFDSALDIGSVNSKRSLQQLKDKLPDFSPENFDNFMHWWQANGFAWSKKLRAIMKEHLNIGHKWQFKDDQMKLLQQYYEANKLLIDCLNSDCYVSREVREEIESTLLLPSV
jgi:hypothetical protein